MTTANTTDAKPATLAAVMDFFNPKGADGKRKQGIAQFSTEFKGLSDTDQAQIKQGLGDGTLTY